MCFINNIYLGNFGYVKRWKIRMNKKTIDIQRDAAMCFELPKKCGKIEELQDINGHLYAIGTTGIYEIVLPDDIDPERTNPNIKPMCKEILDVGFSEPFVARIIGQVFEFLQILPQSVSHKMLITAFDITMSINQMAEILIDLTDQTTNIIKQIDLRNQLNQTVHISQVSSLELKTKAFILEGHKILKQILQLLLSASDIDKYMLFSKLSEITQNDNVKKIIEGHSEPTIEFIWELRNAIEHPSNNNFIKVNNICVSANNKITPPTWEWSFLSWTKNTKKSEQKTSLLDDLNIIIHNLLVLTEDALLCLALHKAYCFIPFEIAYNSNSDKHRYTIKYVFPSIKTDR